MLVSPLVAGTLLSSLGLRGVLLADFATYLFSILTLVLHPHPAARDHRRRTGRKGYAAARGSVWLEVHYGAVRTARTAGLHCHGKYHAGNQRGALYAHGSVLRIHRRARPDHDAGRHRLPGWQRGREHLGLPKTPCPDRDGSMLMMGVFMTLIGLRAICHSSWSAPACACFSFPSPPAPTRRSGRTRLPRMCRAGSLPSGRRSSRRRRCWLTC